PGQIPIKKAMQLMAKESAPMITRLNDARSNDGVGRGVGRGGGRGGGQVWRAGLEIFWDVVSDEKKAIASVLHAKFASAEEFAKVVSYDPIQVGFKAKIVRLSAEEWSTLFRYLTNIVNKG
ncbi:MAG: hypothetical protein HY966_08375, partial [Ignavibacteriales bacterium]|nr:hypothetical protein [Ignavibacteriales bacterium]